MINDLVKDCEDIAKRYETDKDIVMKRFQLIEDELKQNNKTAPYIKVSHLTNKYFREQFYKSKGI